MDFKIVNKVLTKFLCGVIMRYKVLMLHQKQKNMEELL